jgi:outer membrane protein assembly factor BamB
MRFGGRIPLGLAMFGALVLTGCGGTSADEDKGKDTGESTKSVSQPEWRLTEPPTAFEEKPVAKVHESAYAAGDVVFGASLDGFTMHDGRTGELLWEHGQDIDDEPTLDPHLFRMVTGSGPLYLDDAGATVYASTWTLDEAHDERTSLTAFDGATGEVESSRPITVANGSAEVVAVTDDIVLLADGDVHDDFTLGSDFVLRGIGRTSATQVWTREDFAPVGISGTTLVGLDYADASSTLAAGKVVAIDVTTGKELWTAAAPAQAIHKWDEVRIGYVGGRSVAVTVSRHQQPEEATVILDVASGKVVTSHPFAADQCVGQATRIAACSKSTAPPFFFDPSTGKPVEPLVQTEGAKVTAITDDACYVEVDDVGQVITVGSGKRLSDGQQVLPVQLGNGYALTEPGNFWEIYRGR